jgi:hypothetical protein
MHAALSDHRPLHPLSFGACVVFDDGSTAMAWQKKALEYGCTQDAVCQLAPALEATSPPKARSVVQQVNRPRVQPVWIVMADQFGVCHAPFAPARAYLVEHGYGEVGVLVHDAYGRLHRTTANALMPALPGDEWCANDF